MATGAIDRSKLLMLPAEQQEVFIKHKLDIYTVQNQHVQKKKAKTALVGTCGHTLLKRIVASGHNTQA